MSGGGAETVVEGHEKDEEEQGSGGSQWSAGVAQILTACTHLHTNKNIIKYMIQCSFCKTSKLMFSQLQPVHLLSAIEMR